MPYVIPPIVNGTNTQTANFNIQSGSASSVGAIIQGATSQTADLQQWKNSGSTSVASMSPTGALTLDSIVLTSTGNKLISTTGNELVLQMTGDQFGSMYLKLRNRNGQTGPLFEPQAGWGLVDFGFDPKVTGRTQMNMRIEGRDAVYGVIKIGPTPNAVNEIQFFDSNAVSSGFTNAYFFGTNIKATVVRRGVFGIGVDNPSGQSHLLTSSASTIGSIIQGTTSQTADLQQWQNSSGTVLARVTSAGGARFVPRVTTITSSATPTINTDTCDAVTITALATAITSMTTNLTGTPNNFDRLTFRIKDDGTARAITWGASFVASGVALPTSTTLGKVLTVSFIYDSVKAAWACIASVVEA